MAKKSIGNQLLLENSDQMRKIWIDACNSMNSFDANVQDWKVMMTTRSVASGWHLVKNEFHVDTTSGRQVAHLALLVQKNDVTNEIICESWMQRRFFITSEAMGNNIKIANDKEIEGIISSMAIK
jgi:hypothetical protein